ncbi:hypothetical protein PHYPSEUDO_012700 [Phytophthora pseudosyringae]|uniref:Uncharacterized protein n=1 Tax=Phytophthora pseudosyringae TaxID=221518 RepID=A0A8T1W358_9STRA|nr:hypothetical protein PHYPSEUDO_012700 [Phytophthora pseudosyringae]
MKFQYIALNELARSLQLKNESAYDDEEPAVDYEKVSQHLSMALFDDMTTNPLGLEGHLVSANNVGAIEYEAKSDVDPTNACQAVINQQQHVTRESDGGQEATQQERVTGMAAAISVLIQGVERIKLEVNKDVREVPPTRPIDRMSCSAGEF